MENPIRSNLPHELTLEIILRLPVKTLLRFKCVSTEWNTLIGSSTFADRHFNHESNQERLLVRQKKSDDKKKYSFSLYIPATTKNVMGPLNGVFCLINTFQEMAFLNPAMRQFRLVPDLHQSSSINRPHLSFRKQKFGFGLDPSSGDYKLVSIQYFWDTENHISYYPCIISVYNSGTDSWRHFEEVDAVNTNRKIYKSHLNTYLNGVYYWLTQHRDNDQTVRILAFDMRSDKFREIEAPNDSFESIHLRLGLYCGSLALLCYDEVDKYVDAWVMEREGCWTRIVMVGPIEDLCRPLGFWKKHVLYLMETNPSQASSIFCVHIMHDKLALWNPATRRMRPLPTPPKPCNLNGGYDNAIYFPLDYAVYTLGNDSWRVLENEPILDDCDHWSVPRTHTDTFLNGFYYMLKYDITLNPVILEFDMHKEVFEEMEVPNIDTIMKNCHDLTLYNDFLALLSYNEYLWQVDKELDIWVMKEKGSWTKVLTTVLPFYIFSTRGFNRKHNSIFILNENMELSLHDLDSNSTKRIRFDYGDIILYHEVLLFSYKESLASVKGKCGLHDYYTHSPTLQVFFARKHVNSDTRMRILVHLYPHSNNIRVRIFEFEIYRILKMNIRILIHRISVRYSNIRYPL
ncbi:hypothetical protein CDL12_30321 [Handroanthus impetiginosus]|uniref:F-box domain-containing protein n=1 Tax=Handroanthus impetiginosus TaxID=429701 RepID=A0A2G9FWA6_9LAMI|nr:hypothetical protein CDL12_30321 [Handroanthus impetiginosus]